MSAIYLDNEQGFYYLKRFQIEEGHGKRINFIGELPDNKLVSLTWVRYPRFEIEFGGKNGQRENEIIEVDEFIGVKSYKAKGKRLTNYEVQNIKELEPVVKDEDIKEEEAPETDDTSGEGIDDIPFEITRPKDHGPENPNQMSLF